MESDSSLSSIALALSLVTFLFVSLGEACIASVRRERLQRLVAQDAAGSRALEALSAQAYGATGGLALLKLLAFSASLLAGIALSIALWSLGWSAASVGALGVLAVAGLVHALSRAFAQLWGEQVALRTAPLVRALNWLLGPVLGLESAVIGVLLGKRTFQPEITPEEKAAADIGLSVTPAGEPLDEREVRMIRAVMELDRTIAREIMVPRVDMVAVEVNTTIAELAEQMVKWGHSRIPVYREDPDRIEGIAYARDVLRHLSHGDASHDMTVGHVLRPALFIPESKGLHELLREFQEKRVHIAIVVDEYGGVSGLVTIEDLLEEIVGEIRDEFDITEPEIQRISENQFIVNARVSLDQLSELLDIRLEGDGFDTVGGFVYQRLGKIPSQGDVVEYDGVKIEVLSTAGRRLKRLKVTRSVVDSGLATGK